MVKLVKWSTWFPLTVHVPSNMTQNNFKKMYRSATKHVDHFVACRDKALGRMRVRCLEDNKVPVGVHQCVTSTCAFCRRATTSVLLSILHWRCAINNWPALFASYYMLTMQLSLIGHWLYLYSFPEWSLSSLRKGVQQIVTRSQGVWNYVTAGDGEGQNLAILALRNFQSCVLNSKYYSTILYYRKFPVLNTILSTFWNMVKYYSIC